MSKVSVLTSSAHFFTEAVEQAVDKRKMEATPWVRKYLVELLEAHLVTANLKVNSTLAEMLLKANQAERSARIELLRKLGDTSLYISGFFGDSLKRKIVDIDYYADMGGIAYGQLAKELDSDIRGQVYEDISRRFLEYVDLLTYISQTSLVQTNRDLLRLYERYVKTGSELARDQLMENGLLVSEQLKKSSNQ